MLALTIGRGLSASSACLDNVGQKVEGAFDIQLLRGDTMHSLIAPRLGRRAALICERAHKAFRASSSFASSNRACCTRASAGFVRMNFQKVLNALLPCLVLVQALEGKQPIKRLA